MEASERIKVIQIIEKINEYQEFSKKLGVKDISSFRKQEENKSD